MANRLFNPDIQFCDSTGAPYSGGQLFFYASGTSIKQNTYSDVGLTIANSNPIILDSAGRAGPVFLQNLQYKVVLAPSTDTDPPSSPIWTQDPVYTSDYSAAAQFTSGSGSPNGSVAGNAGTATIKASSYWDYTNQILYICTTTGTSTTAVWTAINAATAAAVVPSPQGYLTPVSGTAVITGDSVAATTIYYTPYTGLLVPIYNGTSFVPTSIVSELQYTLTSSLVASNIYDLYIFNNSGVATLGSGPSWSAGTGGSITAGSCARGTGSGGAALSKLQGIWTNAVSMTIRYGDGTKTATVNANQATYVGSMYMDGANGQVSCYRTYVRPSKWGIWNAYNRQRIFLQAGETAASWTASNTGGWTAINGNANNSLTTFCGLAEEEIRVTYEQTTIDISTARAALGWNSTSTPSGFFLGTAGSLTTDSNQTKHGRYIASPALGINVATALQITTSGTNTYLGTIANCLMTAEWRG